jgi:hypothetical protein
MRSDLLHRVGLGILLAHDVEDGRAGLAHGVEDERIALLQRNGEGPVVLDARVLDSQEHVLAGSVAYRPAAHGGDAVGRRDGRAVVEFEAVAQLEGPHELVV